MVHTGDFFCIIYKYRAMVLSIATYSISNLKSGLSTLRDGGAVLQARIAKVTLPFTLLAFYVVWMQGRSDRVVSSSSLGSLQG